MKASLCGAMLLLLVQQPSRENGAIEGVVLRTDTKESISGVRIAVQPVNGSGKSFTSSSDSDGRFLINEVPPGEYLLRAERQGYMPGWGTRPAPDSSLSASVIVNAGQRSAVDVLNFIPGAAVEGRVVNSNGSPASGMTVELLRQAYSNRGVLQWQPVQRGTATTDDRGQYRMFGFGPGNYYLRALKRPPIVAGSLSTGSSVTLTPTTYFPGVVNAALAVPIVLQPGRDTTANLSIPPGDTYKISGGVINSLPSEKSLPAVGLVLLRHDYGGPIEAESESFKILNLAEGSDGRFELRGVAPGLYELFAVSRNPVPGPVGSNPVWVARTSFVIVDRDIDSVSVDLRPGVDVRGKLSVIGDPSAFHLFQSSFATGGGRIVGTQVQLRLFSDDGSPVGTILPPQTDGNTFSFDNIPQGSYSVSVQVAGLQRTAYVADIRKGAQSIFGESLVVESGVPDPLEIIVSANGGTVQGRIIGMTGNRAILVLVPQAPQNRNNPHRYRSDIIRDPSGRFLLNYVAPGEYRLYAWESPGDLPAPYMDPDFMAKYSTRGVAIRVTEVPTTDVEAPLIRMER